MAKLVWIQVWTLDSTKESVRIDFSCLFIVFLYRLFDYIEKMKWSNDVIEDLECALNLAKENFLDLG